ncbi:uncharacterized protein Eint_090050 [Encephalitozoon intestinalis ATCC 50506]|uniref:GPI-anchored wall transfer protein n=1 Tax=Encephalitozoon intestinalis (strain ATCC 50506) TaxID=876142 RepID=E0S918_ENCIT|nr:uncharacterized protein Eint_090050 [Encephalitozoon intestinalis ATCC 50506]ADM12135.1 hypothetical protein Eint_090050 [Encephalitozoon intestinalis ATCC 50506]UTX45936.1 putative membrane protein [Encephalitozoon intestinalis]
MTKTLSEVELFAATSITQLSILVYYLMLPRSAFLEFVFSAIPLYFVVVFIGYSGLIYAGFSFMLIAYLLFTMFLEWKQRKSVWPWKSYAPSQYKQISSSVFQEKDLNTSIAIDRTRSLIITSVAITIFASDFSFYDGRKLGKSMDYGLKLMDIGVGSFVYNAGFFSVKASKQRKIKNILSSFFFGALRYLSKVILKLDVKDAEFGVHLNFFFMLGILNLASLFIDTYANFLVGFAMCLFHEIFLKFFGLEEVIYNSTRSNLITANIEGITFLLPQMGMFLMASDISKAIFKRKNTNIIMFYNLLFFTIFLMTRTYSVPCRRIHNLSFAMIIMFLHTTQGITFGIFNKAFRIEELKMHRFTSKYLLFILVWSNLLVFINKHFFSPKNIPNYLAHGLCIAYLFLVFYVPYVLKNMGFRRNTNQKDIKLFSHRD